MARQRLESPDTTPSARLLAELTANEEDSLTALTLARSQAHRQHLLSLPLTADVREAYTRMA